MTQVKIKQIAGLQTALDNRVDNGGNTPILISDVESNKPAPNNTAVGTVFFSTDNLDVQRNTGSQWVKHGGLVRSVFGRSGVITAQSGDYNASQIDNDSSATGTTVKAVLDGVITGATNVGTAANLFKQKNGHNLELYGLAAGVGIKTLSSNLDDDIVIDVNAGTSANNIVQLDNSARLPAVDGSQLTNLNYAQLSLQQDYIYVGNTNGNAAQVQKSNIPLSDFADPNADISLGTNKITTTATSFVDNALVPKRYVDSLSQGIAWKDSVRAATTTNISISSAPTSVDGVTLSNGDRVLIKDQTTGSENGIYVFNGGSNAMTRAEDADSTDDIQNAAVFVAEGTVHGDQGWTMTSDNVTVGTDAQTWIQFTGLGDITAGDGLTKNNNTMNANPDGSSVGIYNDQIVVRSNSTVGQLLVSSGTAGNPASWGTVDLSSTNAVSNTLPLANGGTGLSTLGTNTVLTSQGISNTLNPVSLGTNTLFGRAGNNVTALGKTSVLTILNRHESMESTTATAGSMTLITLSNTPDDNANIIITLNGVQLQYSTDYTVSSGTVSATISLNEALGGSSTDGNGFANDDVVIAYYSY